MHALRRMGETFALNIGRLPRVRRALYRVLLDWPVPAMSYYRARFWAAQMIAVGKRSRISHSVKITGARNISIGSNTHITNKCILNGAGGITIGNDVLIGYESIIMTSGRNYRDAATPIREQGSLQSAVVIGDDAWLGTRVIVQPGVTIGDGAVVGSGAVVTRSVEPYTVVAGVPAKKIGVRGEPASSAGPS